MAVDGVKQKVTSTLYNIDMDALVLKPREIKVGFLG